MANIFLSRPDIRYKSSYIKAMREFTAEGSPPNWNFSALQAHFDEYVDVQLSKEADPPADRVPESVWWLIVDGVYAGNIRIRHKLNDSLTRFGGHIGYDIRPSMRRKGYGTIQLRLALEKAWELGLDRVLLTCDDDNVASYKIMEANGAVLWDVIDNNRVVPSRRYWIHKPE